jgi:hypothetical protein
MHELAPIWLSLVACPALARRRFDRAAASVLRMGGLAVYLLNTLLSTLHGSK